MKTIFESVDQLEAVLGFHRERHSVLAGNVANLDTPGYTPFEMTLERIPGETNPNALPMAQTSADHMDESGNTSSATVRVEQDLTTPPGPDGNAVSLERELAKIDANRVRYATTSELISRRLALLRYGAGDGAG